MKRTNNFERKGIPDTESGIGPGIEPEMEPLAAPKTKEITPTSEMQKVIDTLSDNEKAIIITKEVKI